ncbi:YjdF family protein [uncultured Clostridium sp.]|uniref:YjdF family protein n=1 Tax=uncultured Clostridium sp. TaxID=59620 RepID=UPI0025DCB329|nr:YjdF family protein [uncultured Clostridium sp.]
MKNTVKLTILFNNPFWIGVFEKYEGEEYEACKVTFGAEPKEAEVYDFVLKNYYRLKFKMITLDEEEAKKNMILKKENPKRVQRMIHKEVKNKGIGTKAQIALKAQHEENKIERKKKSKEEKEQQQQRLFELKQNKRREKHKGH